MQQYKDYTAKASSATSKFGATLKTVAANIGIMLAINLVIQVATEIWDAWNVTVEETQERIDELTGSIENLNSEYETLNSKNPDALSESEKKRLDYLKERIDLEERLLKIEQHKQDSEKIGTGFTDFFDKDSYVSKLSKETSFMHKGALQTVFSTISSWFNDDAYDNIVLEDKAIDFIIAPYDNLTSKIEELRERQQGLNEDTEEYQQLQHNIDYYLQQRQQYSDSLENHLSHALEKQSDYETAIAELEGILSSSYLTSSEREDAENQLAMYNYLLQVTSENIDAIYKRLSQPQEIVDSLDERLNTFTADDLKNLFTEDELKLLWENDFSPDATEEELRDLLTTLQKTVDENPIVISDIFSLENTDGTLTNLGKISESIDTIQNSYKTLTEAIDEYNENGAFSIDTMQSIVELGDDWLDYLVDEEGHLKTDKEALQALTLSRLEDMRVQAINSVIDNASVVKDEASAKEYLASTNYALADSYEELAEKKLADLSVTLKANGLDDYTIERVIAKATADIEKINKLFDNTSVDNWSILGESSSTDVQKEWKDNLDKYLAIYRAELDAGLIDFDTFLNKSRALMDEYYRDGKISAKDYWDSIAELYEQQIEIYDKVLNAVERRLDKEIDGIQDVIDGLEKQNELLEKQKDDYDKILSVVESVYDNQIQALEDEKDLLQDKIDAINDTNDALDLQYRKEQALIELQRSQQQRTKKVYVEGRGYIYDTDQEAIRNAKDELKDIENEEVISKLEKEQEALDESISILERYKEKWSEIADLYDIELNKQLAIALWGADYETLILQNRESDIEGFKNKYLEVQSQIDNNQSMIDSYNEKIEYYENLKEKWADIADAYENAEEDMYLAQLFGATAEKDILSGRLDVIEDFKQKYIKAQEEMRQATYNAAISDDLTTPTRGDGNGIGDKVSSNDEYNNTTNSSDGYFGSRLDQTVHVIDKVSGALLYQASSLSNAKKWCSINEYRIVSQKRLAGLPTILYVVRDFSSDAAVAAGIIPKTVLDESKPFIPYRHTGLDTGYVGSKQSKDEALETLQRVAKDGLKPNEELNVLEKNELVLTNKQVLNISDALKLQEMLFGSNMLRPNMEMPNYSKLNNMVVNKQPVEQHYTFNVTLPNIHDGSRAEQLMREFQRLPLDALQYANRR